MKEETKQPDYSMNFELAMRQLFGRKAEYIASSVEDKKEVKKWLLKAIKKMSKDVQNLDTTTRHKESLMDDLERIKAAIKEDLDLMVVIFRLFMLCSRFLGYDYLKGVSYHTPFYYQTFNQYYMHQVLKSSKDLMELYENDHRNVLIKQREIINNLINEGFDDFQISLILGLSENKVKKMKKEI